jgi:hypothetical protein
VATRVYRHLHTSLALQDHQRAREARHRHTAEHNAERVQTFSAAYCVLIVLVAVCQVLAVRRFFRTAPGGRP